MYTKTIKVVLVYLILSTSFAGVTDNCSQKLNLSIPSVSTLYQNVNSIFLNQKIQDSQYSVFQTKLKLTDPHANYIIQLIKAVADNEERSDEGGAISQNELREIVMRAQGYQLNTKQILSIIMSLDSPELGIKGENLFWAKKAMYMILDLRKNMDKYEEHGFICKFLPVLKDEELFDKRSPILDEGLTLKLDQESLRHLGRNQKQIFVASRCWGWW